jgi:hypothetical protein
LSAEEIGVVEGGWRIKLEVLNIKMELLRGIQNPKEVILFDIK